MDGATLQTRLYAGLAKAAAHIGTAHDQYRGTPTNPLQAANKIATLQASANINGQYSGQVKAEQPYWQVIADGAALQIGDYLVGAHTYAVVALDALLPPLSLRCPHTVTITRPGAPAGVGTQPYGAPTTTTTVATNVPAYVLLKTERGAQPAKLPGDAALRAFYDVLLWLPANTVQSRDLVSDGTHRYQVTAAQWSLLGYTLLCERLEA